MAATDSPTIDRNIDAATRFLDRVGSLTPEARARINTESFGKSAHTTALFATTDEVTALRNKDRDGRVSAFLVDAERRVDSMGLDPEVGDLVKAAARAILVQGRPGMDGPVKQLYSPFETVVPLQTVVE